MLSLQSIKMLRGFHTQVRITGRRLAVLCVALFDSCIPKPDYQPTVSIYRGGITVWVGRKIFTLYFPSVTIEG